MRFAPKSSLKGGDGTKVETLKIGIQEQDWRFQYRKKMKTNKGVISWKKAEPSGFWAF